MRQAAEVTTQRATAPPKRFEPPPPTRTAASVAVPADTQARRVSRQLSDFLGLPYATTLTAVEACAAAGQRADGILLSDDELLTLASDRVLDALEAPEQAAAVPSGQAAGAAAPQGIGAAARRGPVER